MKYQDKMESVEEWEDTVENQEFTYPMWFKSTSSALVVEFDGFNSGEVVIGDGYSNERIYSIDWISHTNKEYWQQVENPNKDLDNIVDEAIEEVTKDKCNNSTNNGGKTDYYQLENAPFSINDFDDFAEWRGLNGSQFNMGKVMWTFNTGRHSGTDYERDLNKIIHYANRELLRLKRGKNET